MGLNPRGFNVILIPSCNSAQNIGYVIQSISCRSFLFFFSFFCLMLFAHACLLFLAGFQ